MIRLLFICFLITCTPPVPQPVLDESFYVEHSEDIQPILQKLNCRLVRIDTVKDKDFGHVYLVHYKKTGDQ